MMEISNMRGACKAFSLGCVKSIIEKYWLGIGFFALLSGMFLLDSRNAYKTSVYVGFFLPTLTLLCLDVKKALSLLLSGPRLWLTVVVVYLAISALWGAEDPVKYFKHAAMFLVTLIGVQYVKSANESYFVALVLAAICCVAIVSAFWLFDYYYLLDHSHKHRFLSGTVDSFGLYDKEDYGTFYNPLLLSHVLVFFVALSSYFVLNTQNHVVKILLAISTLVMLMMLFGAQTRSAWGAALVVVCFNLVCRLRYGMHISLLIVLASFGLLYINSDIVVARGLSYRPEIWTQALLAIQEAPIVGHGMGASISLWIEELGRAHYDTHNLLLALVYYGGAIGFIFLVAFIFSVVKAVYFKRLDVCWSGTWLLVLIVGGMADGGGLLGRPNEHWFNIVLPAVFMLLPKPNLRALKRGES